MPLVHLSLGANLGPKLQNLQRALYALHQHPSISLTSISSLYETEPWGEPDQPTFYNCCAIIETELKPEKLLQVTQQIETDIGRTKTSKWGPLIIDIDILYYGDTVFETKELTIPHTYVHERAFVLVPLNEIAPDTLHPKLKQTTAQLLEKVGSEGVELAQEQLENVG
jgi:2-amino-4-hydroxy-6-hydroxymethyldihydropteridine diphosphokinase